MVAAAIDLRGHIRSASRSDRTVELHLLDLDEVHTWNLDELPEPGRGRIGWQRCTSLARRDGCRKTAGGRK